MAELQQGLIGGRGKKQSRQARRRFDECQIKVRGLRGKNNELQKQIENQLDSDIRQAIKQQGYYLEKEIGDIKNLITKASADFTDPHSKMRIKELLNLAGKEIERNKRIMEDFINRASTSRSFLKGTAQRERISKTTMEKRKASYQDSRQEQRYDGVSLVQSDQITGQAIMQQRINTEKAALLRQIQEKNNKINQLYNEMGELVGGEQRDIVDVIDRNINTTHQNMKNANQQLDDAIHYQRKSKKKYLFLVTCIIIVVLVTAGTIYLFVK